VLSSFAGNARKNDGLDALATALAASRNERLAAMDPEADSEVLRLETNRALGEAIELYRGAGFAEVVPFNDEPYAHHWFEKALF
jgi:hypothetical protein